MIILDYKEWAELEAENIADLSPEEAEDMYNSYVSDAQDQAYEQFKDDLLFANEE